MASFCFSSRHTAEKQGSVPAQQSESSVPSVKCGAQGHCSWGLLHENTFLLLSPWSGCHFPTSSLSFLAAAAVHLFIFNASLAEAPSPHRENAVIFSGAGSNSAVLGCLGGDTWAGFGRELFQEPDLLLDLEELQSKAEGVYPGGSPGSFRDRWGPLALL